MKKSFLKQSGVFLACVALATCSISFPAQAAIVIVRGKIIVTQGHESPNCRMVMLRRSDNGSTQWFRIGPGDGQDDIMAVTLTAVVSRQDVEITYDQAATSGCGTEPRILYIAIFGEG